MCTFTLATNPTTSPSQSFVLFHHDHKPRHHEKDIYSFYRAFVLRHYSGAVNPKLFYGRLYTTNIGLDVFQWRQ